jgi:serine/threonine-protein kinase HipA
LTTIAGRKCLVSRRFDRDVSTTGTARLHQEDLCQAIGIPTNLKYESDSGPGFQQFRWLLQVIGRGADVNAMVRSAVLNFTLGNSDAHGKNFAILFAAGGRRLAPLYDIVSTAAYDLDDAMAMAIGGNFEPESVLLVDWMDMSADCDLAPGPFFALVRETALEVHRCAADIAVRARAGGWHEPIVDEIVAIAARRSELIAAALKPD